MRIFVGISGFVLRFLIFVGGHNEPHDVMGE